MVAHMKVNGKLIINTELVYFSILIILDTMGNFVMICDRDMGLITTPIMTNTKVIGIMIFSKVWGHIITQTVTSIKVNGKVES